MLALALPRERHRVILERLASDGRVVAAEIARELATSEDTIRRDLRELAGAGRCMRVYGGALPVSPTAGTLREREAQAPARKTELARRAARLPRQGEVVFLDAGSTNIAIAQALPDDMELTVVTNAPAIAAALLDRSRIEVVILGGRFDRRAGATTGARAVAEASRIRADLCFLGACSVSPELGIGAFDPEEAELKRALVGASERLAVAAVTEKLGTRAPYLVAAAADLDDLIVESGADRALLDAFARAGTRVHDAGGPSDD